MVYFDDNGLEYLCNLIRINLNTKQNKITGTNGYLVALDSNGNITTIDPATVGVTDSQLTEKLLDYAPKDHTHAAQTAITGNAGTATKLQTAREIKINLGSTNGVSFDGSADANPGVTGTLPISNGGTGATTASTALNNLGAAASNHTHTEYLPITGGTLTGDLRIKGSANYGTKINLGDGDYVYLYEKEDDCLEIKAKKINFVTTQTPGLLNNGEEIGGNSIDTPISVANGGTGLSSLTSGSVLIGNGTSSVSLRAITNNTSTTSSVTASTNLVTMNTLRYALNRTTGPGSADTSYSTAMMRAIYAGTSDLTAGSSSLTSGQIYLVYE